MKVETFIKKLKLIENYHIQTFFDKEYGGACPCFSGSKTIDGKKLYVWGRCWRVSDSFGAQELHVGGELDKKTIRVIAKIIKKALDAQKWYNTYRIYYHDLDFFRK